MLRFVIRRLFSMVVVMLVISILTFLLFAAIPNGNPAENLAGRLANPEQIHLIDVRYGFDKPIYVQYVKTMKNIFTGQAYSYQQGFNVLDEVKAGIFWLLASILVGTLAAVFSGRIGDRLLTVLAMIGVSFPPFFLGAVFIYYLGYKANFLPIGNYVPLGDSPWEWFKHLILPWITLSVLFIGFYSRVLRSTILDTVNEDFVRTARAKGLSGRQVLLRHTLRNSLIPIISLWGLDFASVIGGGAILTESVYNLHGVGQLAAQAIGKLDIITVMVVVMLGAFAVVFIAALIDVVYAFLDPRIRLA
jgi:peptide/nickel transport system permease protein